MPLLTAIKVLVPSIAAFIIGVLLTPILTYFLYKYKMWKKKSVAVTLDGREASISASLHQDDIKQTPRMGGIIIWFSAIFTTLVLWSVSKLLPFEFLDRLDFISRSQTWIPLSMLLLGSLVGLLDDFMSVNGSQDHIAGGLSLTKRLGCITVLSLICGLWFYNKLDVATIGLPFMNDWYVGWLIVPIFIIVTLAIYSGGVIDGIDGLSGGVFASIFSAYGVIAFFQGQTDLAAFCAVVVGGILAFLWFNIPPARFYMSETGSMGLTVTLAVVAFLTDSLGNGYGIIVLPIIALPLVLASGSAIIQLTSKKLRGGKKVFLVAPIHHHFEALGWPSYKVTMRFWIISVVAATFGVILALIG